MPTHCRCFASSNNTWGAAATKYAAWVRTLLIKQPQGLSHMLLYKQKQKQKRSVYSMPQCQPTNGVQFCWADKPHTQNMEKVGQVGRVRAQQTQHNQRCYLTSTLCRVEAACQPDVTKYCTPSNCCIPPHDWLPHWAPDRWLSMLPSSHKIRASLGPTACLLRLAGLMHRQQ